MLKSKALFFKKVNIHIIQEKLSFRTKMVYDVSMKGNERDMMKYEKINEIIQMNKGIIQTSQVIEIGISKPLFYSYVQENGLKQIAHGIYVTENAWIDAMYILHLRSKESIFSHESALFFHDLTDREPTQLVVTVKTGYNPSRLKLDGIQVYTVKKELHDLGLTMMKTTFGNEVPVYDMERTICDLIRNRKSIEIQIFQDALKRYAKRKDKNLRRLMKYAKEFRVESILNQYLEVLL